LLDCQGLFDPKDKHCKATDTLITLFALELSNIHIYNLKGDVHSPDLDHLQVRYFVSKNILHVNTNKNAYFARI